MHFVHDTTENRTNTVESPFETDVLRDILIFIYSNTAPRVGEMPDKLLEAADYYQLDRLKEMCVRVLRAKLTVENAIDTLQLADKYRDESLKQATIHFIRDQSPHSIMNSEGWANLKCLRLLTIISRCFVEDDYDPDILKQYITDNEKLNT
ncbi:hypothetical protein O3G_MSEX011607 [Manduca sexta]|uniref:BTB domain-containing protein n=2 Tax=Manduca sexta TaxID=7130 RepID=A0A921ZLL1_MANSE|nr:hypothetical protein O3G_MSEX011607 [Manduca sexta]